MTQNTQNDTLERQRASRSCRSPGNVWVASVYFLKPYCRRVLSTPQVMNTGEQNHAILAP